MSCGPAQARRAPIARRYGGRSNCKAMLRLLSLLNGFSAGFDFWNLAQARKASLSSNPLLQRSARSWCRS